MYAVCITYIVCKVMFVTKKTQYIVLKAIDNNDMLWYYNSRTVTKLRQQNGKFRLITAVR